MFLSRYLCLLFTGAAIAAQPAAVREPAREIPLTRDVDVVVVGGTTAAVAAAEAAARAGAKVFLAAPRPYLGDDLCAKMRLWLEPGEKAESGLPARIFSEGRGPVRPMHVKKTLDDALVAAGVPFLFSSYPSDLLRDEKGRLAGVVIANRAGRQAIRARVIIDATERATVARLAGARFRPFPAKTYTFWRYIAGGDAPPSPAVRRRATGMIFRGDGSEADQKKPQAKAVEIIEYSLDIAMRDASFASFARAEQKARDLTASPTEQFNTDELFFIPPDSIRAAKPFTGAGEVPLEALQPAGVSQVFVLSAMADVPRDRAAKLVRPVEFMALGERVGAAAARLAAQTTVGSHVTVVPSAAPAQGKAEVKEILEGERPAARGVPKIKSAARSVPVLGSYDVVVVGGGTGGAPAAIAAARSGAKVLVVEYLYGLGGVGTMGLITSYYWGFRGGFTKEIPGKGDLGTTSAAEFLKGGPDRKSSPRFVWNPLERSEWFRREILKAGGEIWYGAAGCGAVVESNRVTGVMVATPQGRGAVLARMVIDSTGNSDIAAAAGAETVHTGVGELAQQGVGLPFVKLAPGSTNTDFTLTDETDMVDVSHLFVYAKEKYAEQFDLGQLIDSRERRRIVGDFEMTLLDALNERSYPDTISLAWSNFDTHGYTVDPYLLLDHPERVGFAVKVPYRCLIPKGLDGILVTGLSISAHRDALPLLRMQADIHNQGYAVGLAAATLAKTGQPVRALDIRALQKKLAALDIVPESVLQEQDSYPIPDSKVAEAVKRLKDDSTAARILMAKPESASPLLRSAYREAQTDKDKLTYAMALAVLGDAGGVPTLIAALESQPWDKGWDYKGMGQFGAALSRVDGWIVALGRTRDRRALPAILKKAAELNAQSEFSHHRAVALALEMIADPSAAPVLAALLNKPGMRGYVVKNTAQAAALSGKDRNDNRSRAVSLRELSLARALYRCGDYNGLGKAILEEYAGDLRGHLARHARAVLEDIRQGAPR